MYEKQRLQAVNTPANQLKESIEYWQKERDKRLSEFIYAEVIVNDMKEELLKRGEQK